MSKNIVEGLTDYTDYTDIAALPLLAKNLSCGSRSPSGEQKSVKSVLSVRNNKKSSVRKTVSTHLLGHLRRVCES